MEKKNLIDFNLKELIEETRKPSANPGGGAITSLVGNLGLNLILMMAKNDYKDERLNIKGKNLKKTFINYSKELEAIMQDDVDNVQSLVKSYKNPPKDSHIMDELIKKANIAPNRTIEIMIIILNDCKFLLKHGKISTISDGEICLRLIKEAIHSSFVNLLMNEKNLSEKKDRDYKSIIAYCNRLFDKNMEIIRKREKAWD